MHALAPSVPADVRALLASLGIEVAAAATPAQRSPERVLGQALSLPRTVRLAETLSTPAADAEAEPCADHAALLQHAAQRLVRIRERVARSYAGAFAGKHALPDAARVHALLVDGAAGADPATARKRTCAALARGCADLLESTLAAMQRELDLLKQSTRAMLQRAYPPGSGLLALDPLIDPVITLQMRDAHRGLVRAYERACAARLQAAAEQLPPECGVEAVGTLFAARGAVTALLADARRLIETLLDLEWSVLHGLIDALCAPHETASGR